jgi:hypothetical protein
MTTTELLDMDLRIFFKECNDEMEELHKEDGNKDNKPTMEPNKDGTDWVYNPPGMDWKEDPEYIKQKESLKGG